MWYARLVRRAPRQLIQAPEPGLPEQGGIGRRGSTSFSREISRRKTTSSSSRWMRWSRRSHGRLILVTVTSFHERREAHGWERPARSASRRWRALKMCGNYRAVVMPFMRFASRLGFRAGEPSVLWMALMCTHACWHRSSSHLGLMPSPCREGGEDECHWHAPAESVASAHTSTFFRLQVRECGGGELSSLPAGSGQAWTALNV